MTEEAANHRERTPSFGEDAINVAQDVVQKQDENRSGNRQPAGRDDRGD